MRGLACAAVAAIGLPLGAADPVPGAAARRAIERARAFEAEGKAAEARAALEGALAREPDPVLALELGNRCFEAGDLAGAVKGYRRAIDLAPGYGRAHKNLGRALYRLERYAEAAESLARGIAEGGPDPETLLVLADARARAGAYAEAVWAYRFALALRPGDGRSRRGLVAALAGARRYGEAAELCRDLLRERPADGELWRLRAQLASGAGRMEEAADALEALRVLGAARAEDLGWLGDVLFALGLEREAAEAYGEAAEAGALSPRRALARAQALWLAGEAGRAEEAAESLPEEVAESAGGVALRARIAAARGKPEEAEALWERAIRAHPLDGELLLAAARFRWSRGDLAGAEALLRSASLLEATRRAALRDLVRLLIERGEREEALRVADQALEAGGDEALRRLREELARWPEGD